MSAALSLRTAAVVDLATVSVRDLNHRLHDLAERTNATGWTVRNPQGRHAIAVGVDRPLEITVDGHVGYYCGGFNCQARIDIRGNAGVGVAENMMSGNIRVRGDASQSAGATGRGGLLVIEGNAGARCGISMKGINIVVRGSVGHMGAFMAQEGNLVVLGDAGESLGDSLYEARLFVRGSVRSLGADCEEKTMDPDERRMLLSLLEHAGVQSEASPDEFRLYGSARRLYHFHIDNADSY